MQPVEMALEAALLVMQNGGSTVAAERSFSNILKGYKKDGVAAVWRLDFIAATSTADGQSSAVVRPVGPLGVNLVRASEVAALGERTAKGDVALAAFAAEVERIKKLPSPYNRWVTILAAACTAAFFSQIPGGDWGSLAVAFVAAGVGQFFRSMLQAKKLAVAPVTLICGVISACIASFGLSQGFSQVAPATLIASVIYMVPGLPLINGFADVASHKYLFVGIERIANAMFLFLVLAIAIALAATAIM
ncbi:MAG: threonine/serine exporter family protein [Candidatus Binatia bacterium]